MTQRSLRRARWTKGHIINCVWRLCYPIRVTLTFIKTCSLIKPDLNETAMNSSDAPNHRLKVPFAHDNHRSTPGALCLMFCIKRRANTFLKPRQARSHHLMPQPHCVQKQTHRTHTLVPWNRHITIEMAQRWGKQTTKTKESNQWDIKIFIYHKSSVVAAKERLCSTRWPGFWTPSLWLCVFSNCLCLKRYIYVFGCVVFKLRLDWNCFFVLYHS